LRRERSTGTNQTYRDCEKKPASRTKKTHDWAMHRPLPKH
jgi:hypothetical protein